MVKLSCVALAALSALLLSGCTTVPRRDGLAAVHVSDIVARVKCDLANVVLRKAAQRSPYVSGTPFLFLAGWAAKIHLEIAVDKMASVNPGATLMEPLKSVGGVAQSFNLGVGGGATTQAVRMEDYDFLVSFDDLKKEFDRAPVDDPAHGLCTFSPGVLLESDLDLQSMVDSALEPVERGVLRPGNDVGPGALPTPAPRLDLSAQRKLAGDLLAASRNAASFEAGKSDDEKLKPSINSLSSAIRPGVEVKALTGGQSFTAKDLAAVGKATAETTDDYRKVNGAKVALANSAEATTAETRAQALVNNVVKPLYGIAAQLTEPKCLQEVTKKEFSAITATADLSLATIAVYQEDDATKSNVLIKRIRNDEQKAIGYTDAMLKSIDACSRAPRKPPPLPPVYDPIAGITETVNFYITESGSVTPMWKLVQVSAPLSPTFAMATRKDTNTLILTLGRPSSAPDGSVKGSSLAMDTQVQTSLLTSILNQVAFTR